MIYSIVVVVYTDTDASVTSDCHSNRCKQPRITTLESMNHQELKIPDHFIWYYS